MASANPSPAKIAAEIVARAGCAGADDIDQCLLDTCDREMERPEGEPQDIELAFSCARAVILRLDGNEAPEMQRYLAGALFRRAQFLAQLGRPKDARRDFQDVAATWCNSEDPAVRKIVAANYLEAGQFEEDEGNISTAEQCYEYAATYADDPDPATQRQAVDAICNHVDIHIDRGDIDEAGEQAAEIRARWQDHPEYWIRRRIANLLVNYAVGMKEDDERCAEALPLFDEAIAYADHAVDPPAYFIQAGAWLSKCHCLEKLDRHEEAIACVDAMEGWMAEIVRPSADPDTAVNSQAEGSLRNAWRIKARCLNEIGRYDEALAAFDRTGVGVESITDEPDKSVPVLRSLVDRVAILANLGRMDEAETFCKVVRDRVLSFGLPKARAAEILGMVAAMQACVALTNRADGSPDPS